MSMTEAVKTVFSKYGTFSGRARRSEFWYFQLFVFVINMVFGVFLNRLEPGTRAYRAVSGLEGIFALVVFLPSLAVSWRRFHDIGKSGAWSLMGTISAVITAAFVVVLALTYAATGSSVSDGVLASIGLTVIGLFLAVIVVSILMLVWLCREGQAGPNRYGPDPKRPETVSPQGKAPWEY